MKKKIPFSFFLFISAMGTLLFFSSNSTGVAGVSMVGCGGGSCHQQDTATNISIIGLPAGGYINGQTYALQLLVSNASKLGAGFNLMVDGGTIVAGAGAQLNGPQELYHTSTNTMMGGNATWNFSWTAPATGIAPVLFFVAGNAVNMNNNPSNDAFNTNQFSVSSAQTSSAPSITMNTINNITPTSATLQALVNANNSATSCTVEYGATLAYGNTMVAQPTGFTGIADSAVSAILTGLTAGTTYHYRLKATNAVGTSYSADGQFITMPSSLHEATVARGQFFPNPCTTSITYFTTEQNEPWQLQVVNAIGQPQTLPIIPLQQGGYQLQTSQLAQGVYTLIVLGPTRKQFAVFLKQ